MEIRFHGVFLDERNPNFTSEKGAYDPKVVLMRANSRGSESPSIRENPLARTAGHG